MKPSTDARISNALKRAAAIGACFAESGCPRGERRHYAVRFASGKEVESFNLATIEKAITSEEIEHALMMANRLIDEALPKFNWGASFLDADAIKLINDASQAIKAAFKNTAAH